MELRLITKGAKKNRQYLYFKNLEKNINNYLKSNAIPQQYFNKKEFLFQTKRNFHIKIDTRLIDFQCNAEKLGQIIIQINYLRKLIGDLQI